MVLAKSIIIENILIKNKTKILVEAITRNDIEKWNKDFQAFTKNIRRVNSRDDILKVSKALRIYRKNFEEFVLSHMFGYQGYEYAKSYKDSDDNYFLIYVEEAKKTVWELLSLLNSIANDFDYTDYYGKEKITYDNDKPIYIDTYKKGTIDFEKYRDSIYQKLTRLGREAFEDLYEIIDYKKELEDLLITDTITIKGIPTIVTYAENNFEKIKDRVKEIENTINQIEKLSIKNGFKNIFKGLTLVIDSQLSGITKNDYSSAYGGGAGAFFSASDMTINLWMTNLFTFLHELGHKYYYYDMYEEQRKVWDDFIEKNTISISREELEEMSNTLGDYLYEYYLELEGEEYNYHSHSQKSELLFEYVLKNINKFKNLTPIEYSILDTIVSIKTKDPFTSYIFHFNREGILNKKEFNEKIKDSFEYRGYYGRARFSNTFNIALKDYYISDYANANPREAYAETFAHYMLGNYKNLPDLILHQFYFTKPR